MSTYRKALPFLLLAVVALWTFSHHAPLFIPAVYAQANDCAATFTFTGDANQAAISNRSGQTPCVNWRITYSVTGTLTTTVTFETSPDGTSWTAVPSTVCSSSVQPPCVLQGSNPTSGTQGMMYVSAYGAFVRVTTTSSSGTGTGTIRVYGAKGATASVGAGIGGGGQAPFACPVAGVSTITCTHNFGQFQVWAVCNDNADGSGAQFGGSGSPYILMNLDPVSVNAVALTFNTTVTAGLCQITTGSTGPAGATGPTGPAGANGANATGAGAGIGFFLDDTTITASGANSTTEIVTLTKTPVTSTATQTDTINPNANTVMDDEAYLFNTSLGVTEIPGGIWTLNAYAAVNNTAGTASLSFNVMAVTPYASNITTSGSGTSRTATAAAGTPFAVCSGANTVCIVADADPTIASFLQTPQGLYQITARTSDTAVTILTPSTYANEAPAASYSTWTKMFNVSTASLESTSIALNVTATAQPAFTILATSKLAFIPFATASASRTVTFTHNGNATYTNIQSTLINGNGWTDNGTQIVANAGRQVTVGTTCPGPAPVDSVCVNGKFYAGGVEIGSASPVNGTTLSASMDWAPFGMITSCTAAVIPASNQIVLRSFITPFGVTINQIRMYLGAVNPGGGGNRLGVYSSAGVLLGQGSVDSTTAGIGIKTYTFSPALVLTAATRYWMAWGADTNTPSACVGPAAGDGIPYANGLTESIIGKTIFSNGSLSTCAGCGTGASFTLPADFSGLGTVIVGTANWLGIWGMRIN